MRIKFIIFYCFLTSIVLNSCNSRQENKQSFLKLSIDYEKLYSRKEITPFDEKLMENEIASFTKCLEKLLVDKVLRLYETKGTNLKNLPPTKEMFLIEQKNIETREDIVIDSIMNEYENYYFATTVADRYITENCRERIKRLEDALGNQ